MTNTRTREFLPALAYSWLTPMFDFVIAATTREEKFRRRLIDQADLSRAQRVLDIGCGTGSLAVRIKRLFPHITMVGLDADEAMLGCARSKAAAAHLEIQLDRGFSYELPYETESFDRAVSTLFLHHLNREYKLRTLQEAFRVLKAGGQLHIADWGRPTGPIMNGMFLVVRMSDGFDVTRDNVTGQLPNLCEDAGFVDVRECGDMNMMFGTLSFIAARKPDAS